MNNKAALEILNLLNGAGYKAYFVGGCVRDMLMGNKPCDIDITTNAKPEEVRALFERTFDTGIKHGTVTVVVEKIPFEVTTFRKESDYEGHRRPKEVSFVSDICEDLARRDFTVNAIAYHPDEGIIDPFGGEKDIKSKVLRCVGNASERFEEDALRMLRLVRFACKTNFSIEEKTFEAVCKKAELLRFISAERIYAELIKALCSDYPERLIVAYETGLMKYFLPELSECFETEQNTKYHLYNVGVHILKTVCNTPSYKEARLSALFHDIGKPLMKTTDINGQDHFKGHEQKSAELANGILTRLKADNRTKKAVCTVILNHRWEKKIPTKVLVKEKILEVSKQNFPLLLDLMEADTKAHNTEFTKEREQAVKKMREIYAGIIQNNEPLSIKDLKIDGKDVQNMGYTGAEIGTVLEKALKIVVENPEFNTKEILTERLKK